MTDIGTVATMVVGFGAVVLMFRVSRELEMQEKGEVTWVAYSDWLVIAGVFLAGLLGIVLSLIVPQVHGFPERLAAASCATATVLLVGYVLGILAHYRLILGRARTGLRENPEPAERVIVWMFVVLGIAIFITILTI